MNNSIPKPPRSVPTNDGWFVPWLGRFLMKISGWTIKGQLPNRSKFVLAVAPHTSNWDFIVGLRYKFALNLKVNFLGKDSLFKGPFGAWLKYLGGIPINRRAAHGVVGQLASQFKQKDALVLVVAPEGTRSKVNRWKTGFLQIAHQANVPVVGVEFDYTKKQIICYPEQHIGSDIEAELAKFQSNFDGQRAKIPNNF